MNKTPQPRNASDHERVGHELSDLKPRDIALFGAALAVAIIVVMALSHLIFKYAAVRYANQQVPPSPLAHTREPTAEPRLQLTPAKDLREMRVAEDAALDSYGWIDQKSGIVRIPVQRAIELLAERGMPVRQKGRMQKAERERKKINGTK
jgi:hypothetical protein